MDVGKAAMMDLAGIREQAWDPLKLQAPGQAREKDLHAVAEEFEAVLIGQMLKTMRESTGAGWMGTGADSSAASVADFAEQQVAGVMARSGGFGLAGLIAKGLERKSADSGATGGAIDGPIPGR